MQFLRDLCLFPGQAGIFFLLGKCVDHCAMEKFVIFKTVYTAGRF